MALGAGTTTSPVDKVKTFLEGLKTDLSDLGLTVCTIGFIVCAFMIYRGSEENVPRFQKGAIWTGGAVAVIVLARIIVDWIKNGVN